MRRVAMVSLMLLLACSAAGCKRKAPPRPAPPVKAPVAESPQQAAASAKTAVVAYLTYLEQGDYKAAHALLTSESQAQHPLDEFATQARKAGPLYDLKGARATPKGRGEVVVSVPMVEDPARVTFEAAKQADQWRVVYHTGRPWAPYP